MKVDKVENYMNCKIIEIIMNLMNPAKLKDFLYFSTNEIL